MSSKRIVDLRKGKLQVQLPFFGASQKEKRTSLRDRRRNVRVVALFSLLAVVLTLLWAVHAFSYLPQFTVQRVEVKGATRVPPRLVAQYVNNILDDDAFHFIARRNLFHVPQAAIIAAIPKNFPRVQSAALSRTALFDTTLTVTLTERIPFARWCMDPNDATSSCFLMDQSGFIFADSSDVSEVPKTLYIFSGGSRNVEAIGRTFAAGDIETMIALLQGLNDAGFVPRGITLQAEGDFFVPLLRGFYIKVSPDVDPVMLVRNVQLVLSSDALKGKEAQLDYIDLRFGNRVYYKLKGQEESPAQ